MSFMEDVAFLGEVAGFAGEMAARPLAVVPEEWQEHCDFLDGKLTELLAQSAYRRELGNFAPLLITALRRALAARRAGDERGAGKWDCLVGHLTPLVREDGAAILARAKG
jgi:hypothetical protein